MLVLGLWLVFWVHKVLAWALLCRFACTFKLIVVVVVVVVFYSSVVFSWDCGCLTCTGTFQESNTCAIGFALILTRTPQC